MGIWTHFDGKIVLHNAEHVSINKAFKEFFDGHEASINVYQSSINSNIDWRIMEVDIVVEEELEISLLRIAKFLDHLKNMCKYPQHMKVDINVEGRVVR